MKHVFKVKCRHNYITNQYFGRCLDYNFNCRKIRNIEDTLKTHHIKPSDICRSIFEVDWVTFITNRQLLIEVKE
jgi:hypothetical protein